jgi:hypothetical protein
MAGAGLSETPLKLCQFTRRHISEDSNLRSQHRENLKSDIHYSFQQLPPLVRALGSAW